MTMSRSLFGVDDRYRVYTAARSRTAFAKGHFRSGTAAVRLATVTRSARERFAGRARARAIFLVARQVAAKIGGETTHPATAAKLKTVATTERVARGEAGPITIDAPLSSDRCGRGRLPPCRPPRTYTYK